VHRYEEEPEIGVPDPLAGLRWGEPTGLRIRDLDMLRRRATISENAVEVAEVLRHYIHDPELGVAAVQAVRQIDARAITG
jgi:hypothetical protein